MIDMDIASARRVLESLLEGIAQGKWHELHELYAQDAVIEYPFALPSPMRVVGREAIRQYFARAARQPLQLRARDIVMHDTHEPGVILVQWGYDAHVTTTGRTFQVSNLQLSKVQDGLIVRSHDYHNHAFMAAMLGHLGTLAAAMDPPQSGRVTRVAARSEPKSKPSELDVLLTPLVTEVWTTQRRLVTPEHVLLQLLRQDEIAAHLASHSVDATALSARLLEFVATLPQRPSEPAVIQPLTDDALKVLHTSLDRVHRQGRGMAVTKFDLLDVLLDETLGLAVTRWILEVIPAGSLDALRGVSGRSCVLCSGLAQADSSVVVPYRGILCGACVAAIVSARNPSPPAASV